MQGRAAAYDLARLGGAEEVLLVDADLKRAGKAGAQVNRLIKDELVQAAQVDVQDRGALIEALEGYDVALSAVPYRFNLEITEAAMIAKGELERAVPPGPFIAELGRRNSHLTETVRWPLS